MGQDLLLRLQSLQFPGYQPRLLQTTELELSVLGIPLRFGY